MDKRLKISIYCFLIIIAAVFYFFTQYKDDNLDTAEEKKNMALIMNLNNGYHWASIKTGVDTAAREYNVNIDFDDRYNEENTNRQIELINQAIEKKVDAIILEASDFKGLVKEINKAYDRKIPVMIIDSEVDTKKINSFIGTDNFSAGKKAGSIVVDATGENSRIAIMSFESGTKNAQQREEGLRSVISTFKGIKIVAKEFCNSDTRVAAQLTKRIINLNSPIDAIVALNSTAAEGAAETVEQMGLAGKVKIVCFDNTLNEINYLEKGVIQGIITQNPFSMGYLSVKYALDLIDGKKIPAYVDTGSKIINIENMYFPENQRLLFPSVN